MALARLLQLWSVEDNCVAGMILCMMPFCKVVATVVAPFGIVVTAASSAGAVLLQPRPSHNAVTVMADTSST
jgi:hypothetical protein